MSEQMLCIQVLCCDTRFVVIYDKGGGERVLSLEERRATRGAWYYRKINEFQPYE